MSSDDAIKRGSNMQENDERMSINHSQIICALLNNMFTNRNCPQLGKEDEASLKVCNGCKTVKRVVLVYIKLAMSNAA